MGDATGIGPEITVRALLRAKTYEVCSPVVIGDAGVMQATVDGMKVKAGIWAIRETEEARFRFGTIDVVDLANIQLERLKRAQVDAMAGEAVVQSLFRAIELALSKKVDGIVTAPLHKMAMHQAGYDYPGHTEILAEKSGTADYAMMFVADGLRVVLVTIHCALKDALEGISQKTVVNKIRLAQKAMHDLGFDHPRIAVAGLNPHAGEGGLFGHEEIEIVEPAIREAQSEGIDATGPYPADTLFARALKGQFDIVVAMYHDQGLIPVKLVGFEKGVNITLGLPFVRTSPDHGTAFGKAWQWRADPGSMEAAIDLAAQMASANLE
jgi:4-hydroxythreonine-4-phosphate dehydrogenase